MALDLNATTEELVKLRNTAATAYYSGDIEDIMNDFDFDVLLKELKSRGVAEVPAHGYVLSDSVLNLPKVKHEYPMQSLRKVHDMEDIEKWAKPYWSKGFSIQPKYDGSAINFMFDEDGNFVQAATRGDHKIGEDVTSSALAMIGYGRIPGSINTNGFKGNTHIRGEVYMTTEDFIALNKFRLENDESEYDNIRNAVAGLVRRSDTKLTRFLSFVAYDTNNYEDDEIEFLDGNGFVTPKEHFYVTATKLSEIEEAIEKLNIMRFDTFNFITDGVVIKVKGTKSERNKYGVTSQYPRWGVAYKFEEEATSTVIRKIQWNHNRTGMIAPVAIFDIIPLGELRAKTSRASMGSYARFKELNLRADDHILVIRANGVIPYIVGLDPEFERSAEPTFEAPAFMPTAEYPTRLSETGKHLLAAEDAPPPLDLVIENSVNALDLKNVGNAFITEMIEAGRVNHFLDLLTITYPELLELRGLPADKLSLSSQNSINALQKAFEQPLWRWISAMGMRLIAGNKSPVLEKAYGSLEALAEAKFSDLVKLERFNGDVHANTVIDSREVIEYWAQRLRDDHNFVPQPEAIVEVQASVGSVDYNGKKVVVTGTFPTMARKDVEAWVKAHGGSIGSSVSGSTDILLYGEKAGTKLDKAKQLGTQLVKAKDFERENA